MSEQVLSGWFLFNVFIDIVNNFNYNVCIGVKIMARTTNVNIRMDEDLKKLAEQLFSELGLNMTTAVNIFVRQAVNLGGIPFDIVKKDAFYSEFNQTILKRSIDQLNAGRGTTRELLASDND
jgi:DNA-damage-inducible protein J